MFLGKGIGTGNRLLILLVPKFSTAFGDGLRDVLDRRVG